MTAHAPSGTGNPHAPFEPGSNVTGPWIPLALNAKVEADPNALVPAARMEQNGTVVKLRGGIRVKAANTVIVGGTLAQLPSGIILPAHEVGITFLTAPAGGGPTGQVSISIRMIEAIVSPIERLENGTFTFDPVSFSVA